MRTAMNSPDDPDRPPETGRSNADRSALGSPPLRRSGTASTPRPNCMNLPPPVKLVSASSSDAATHKARPVHGLRWRKQSAYYGATCNLDQCLHFGSRFPSIIPLDGRQVRTAAISIKFQRKKVRSNIGLSGSTEQSLKSFRLETTWRSLERLVWSVRRPARR